MGIWPDEYADKRGIGPVKNGNNMEIGLAKNWEQHENRAG